MQDREAGEPWVAALKSQSYGQLGLNERILMLAALVHLTLDGPTLRNTLEARLEEAGRVRKQMWEDARVSSLTSGGVLHCILQTGSCWHRHKIRLHYHFLSTFPVQTEKKKRQAEAAAKAKAAAEEAQRVMDMIKNKEGSLAPSEAGEAGSLPKAEQQAAPSSGASFLLTV